jgi:hypothetical protein
MANELTAEEHWDRSIDQWFAAVCNSNLLDAHIEKALVDGKAATLAKAAPELLAACKMLVASYMPEAGTYALGELYQAREAARSAIVTAEA